MSRARTSPGAGIEWNVQRGSPDTGSKPRTSPGGASGMVRRVRDRRADDHGVAADHDRRTDGVGAAPAGLSRRRPWVRSTAPPAPKLPMGSPVNGSTAREPRVAGAVEEARRRLLRAVGGGPAGPVACATVHEAQVRGPAGVVGLRIVDPLGPAGCRVERGDLAEARCRVEPVSDLDRRRLVTAGLHPATPAVGDRSATRSLSGDDQRQTTSSSPDVAGVDLIERRVALSALVAGGHRPLAVLGGERGEGDEQAEGCRQGRHGTRHSRR